MENILFSTSTPDTSTARKSQVQSVSIYTIVLVFSVTSIIAGVIWDISWHMSIGRDTLFSPPHLLIYLGGLLSGLGSFVKMLVTTFSKDQKSKEKAVSFWGFKAPLGALLSIWGAAAMLTSAPFDDWWHNTYGLDVKILSPPHAVLFMGIIALIIAAMLNVLSLQNQQDKHSQNTILKWLFAYCAGIFLIGMYIFIIEHMGRTKMHNPLFYQVACGVLIIPIVSTMRGSRLKYPATAVTGFYMAVLLLQLWILPLFPAQPKLAPILNPITHFVPLLFPLVLIVPGYALDKVFHRIENKNIWIQALYGGITFFGSFLLTHWFFSYFLNSEYSQNWIFQTQSLPYYRDPNLSNRFDFLPYKGSTIEYLTGFAIAIIISILSTRVALAWGNWMRRVQR